MKIEVNVQYLHIIKLIKIYIQNHFLAAGINRGLVENVSLM